MSRYGECNASNRSRIRGQRTRRLGDASTNPSTNEMHRRNASSEEKSAIRRSSRPGCAGCAHAQHLHLPTSPTATRCEQWVDGSGSLFCFVWFSNHRNPVRHEGFARIFRKLLCETLSADLALVLFRAPLHVCSCPTYPPFRNTLCI